MMESDGTCYTLDLTMLYLFVLFLGMFQPRSFLSIISSSQASEPPRSGREMDLRHLDVERAPQPKPGAPAAAGTRSMGSGEMP